jgi:shikimate kinase
MATVIVLYGPKAVGNSLVAQMLAERLGVHHVDFDWALSGAGRSTA